MILGQTLIEKNVPGENQLSNSFLPETIYEQASLIMPPAETGFNLIPGAQFLKFRLVEPVRVASGEADLWVAVNQENRSVVLKIYRWGLKPKEEVVNKLKNISLAQVVEVYERGVISGRHYEVMEYARHGTLVDLWKTNLNEQRRREVLRELTCAITALHKENMLHRDLKPSNILVRSLEPLDLILTDFGISSLSETSIYVSENFGGTPAYCAPEVMTGAISKATDWWSVGVIMLELISGRHPFAGLDSRQINFALATKGIPIPAEIADAWKTLLKGLLTRDFSKRWNEAAINKWLNGEKNIPVYYEGDAAQIPLQNYRPYKFLEQDYQQPADLAVELAQQWDEGVQMFGRRLILEWIQLEVKDQDLVNNLMGIFEDSKLGSDQKFAVGLVAMNKQLPLSWRGQIVNPAFLANDPVLAVAFFESSISAWMERLKKDNTLKDLIKRYKDARKNLKNIGIELDEVAAAQAVLAEDSKVYSLAYKAQREYRASTLDVVSPLLSKNHLSWNEALILALAPPNIFHRREDVTPESLALEDLNSALQAEKNGPYSRKGEERIAIIWDESEPILGNSPGVNDATLRRINDARERLAKWSQLEKASAANNEREILAAWGGGDLLQNFAPANSVKPNIAPFRHAISCLDKFLEQLRLDPNDDESLWNIWKEGLPVLGQLRVAAKPVMDLEGVVPAVRAAEAEATVHLVNQMRTII